MKSRFLDPIIVDKFLNQNIKPKGLVEGFVTGLHRSPFHGFSVEFAEHRPYSTGDEIKHLDWKVYGKSDRFYVKQYEDETNMRVCFLLDISKSMSYKSNGISKLEYGCYLVALLSYILLKQGDAVGFFAFNNSIRHFIPPKSTLGHLQTILEEFEKIEPEGDTDLSKPLNEIAEKMKRRALIFIISDLIDDEQKVISALRHFRHNKHECTVFHILDEMELNLSFGSMVTFEDLENKERLQVDTRYIADDYKKEINNFIDRYKQSCSESMIEYVQVTTGIPYDQFLTAYLNDIR